MVKFCTVHGRKDNHLNNEDKKKASPEERVDRMNGIFDRLVLPMVLFTIAVFVFFAVIPKLGSCSCAPEDKEEQISSQEDFYSLRSILISDMAGNRSIFEAAGYTVMENGDAGDLIAYRELESGAEIIDNLRDTNGTAYSIIYKTDADTGIETNILIYGKSLFLVMVTAEGQNITAIFYNEDFTADVSSGDSGQSSVLALVTSESMAEMLEEYKASMNSIVGE